MELFKEVLAKALEKEEIQVIFPNLNLRAAELVEMKCYAALKKIKDVIENDSLSDEDCFIRIEEIVSILEEIGSNGCNRHDF